MAVKTIKEKKESAPSAVKADKLSKPTSKKKVEEEDDVDEEEEVKDDWDASEEEEVEVAAEGVDHSSFKAGFAHLTSDGVPDLVSLPPPSEGTAEVSRREVAGRRC